MDPVNAVDAPIEAAAPPVLVTIWGSYCPLGYQCKKGNQCMCKKESLEAAKRFLVNHLMMSPYHGLDEQQARDLAETANIESWDEHPNNVKRSREEETKGWVATRKRQRTTQPKAPGIPPLPELPGGSTNKSCSTRLANQASVPLNATYPPKVPAATCLSRLGVRDRPRYAA